VTREEKCLPEEERRRIGPGQPGDKRLGFGNAALFLVHLHQGKHRLHVRRGILLCDRGNHSHRFEENGLGFREPSLNDQKLAQVLQRVEEGVLCEHAVFRRRFLDRPPIVGLYFGVIPRSDVGRDVLRASAIFVTDSNPALMRLKERSRRSGQRPRAPHRRRAGRRTRPGPFDAGGVRPAPPGSARS